MKKIKLLLFLSFFVTEMSVVFSQSTINDDFAHRRYWYYRTRFINDFIKMGKNQGECIVLAERNQGLNNGIYDSTAKVGPDQIDLSNMYLATLALEYKLLTRNNQNTDETIKEIYQLLYTINRLDLQADKVWSAYAANSTIYSTSNGVMVPNTTTTDMNGYIMREDAHASLIRDNLNHFNYELTESGCTGTGGFTGLPYIGCLDNDSKFRKYFTNPLGTTYSGQTTIPLAAEVSLVHDKYYSMLAAFMFIVKYIPSNTYYYEGGYAQPFQDGSWGIKEQAIAITNRLYNYIQGNTFPHPAPNEWILRQPDGSTIGYTAGAMMTNYSFSTSRAICHINGGYPWAWTDVCSNYSDQNSQTIGLQAYSLLGGAQLSEDLAVFTAWNQAYSNFPVGTFPCWLGMTGNTSYWNLEWAELVREILFQTHAIQASTSSIENPIQNAPCEGPWSQASNNNWAYFVNNDWSSQDRTEHPSSQGKTTTAFPGNYPGVDYMFLHNLFYEYLNQQNLSGKYDKAINLMDNLDEQSWPMYSVATNGLVGTTATPAYVHVFQNLSSRAQIDSNVPSQVDYRAGKEIALLPENGSQLGFSVQTGSEFAAYIQRYLCSNGDYGNGLRPEKNSDVYDYETDNMNTSVPTHSVAHPLSDSDLFPNGTSETVTQNQNQKWNENQLLQINISPNPNNGIFTVAIKKIDKKEIVGIRLLNLNGVVLYENGDFETQTLNLANYAEGVYILQYLSNKRSSGTAKLVIVH